MAEVEQGRLDGHCPVVSTDEIGAVAEGFNRMLQGLREREMVKETFGKYVTPEIRDAILAGRVRGEGQLIEATMLFADLRDFTPWVEATEPREVVRDLNEYFTEMDRAIRAHGGLVLQFIGDEIEAVFGAPIAAGDHAGRAVHAAIEMRERLQAWNARREAAGRPRCATASASTPAPCWPATSAGPSGSPTRWSATRSTSPRASRDSPRTSRWTS